jgi:large subunit ribosomal protein L9
MKKSHKKLEIVLLTEVEKLGVKGDKVEVAKGFAINFLFPKKLAILASEPRAKALLRKAEKEKEAHQKEIEKANVMAEKIAGMNLKIKSKIGKADKLFGSVTSKDILQEIEKIAKIKLGKVEVLGTELPIKKVGDYKLKIKLAPGIEPEIKLSISANDKKEIKQKVKKKK